MSEENEFLLEVDNLHTSFFTDNGEVRAVNGISFKLTPGTTLGIVGESGSGKSVTAYSIMQILAETGRIVEGSVSYKGENITNWSERQLSDFRGSKVSIIFQDPMTSLNPVFTVGFQLEEAIRLHTGKNKMEAKARAIEMLTLVGVNEPESRIRQYPHELSGGMRQRVMIAMALCCEPDILIADEPTTALDVTIQAQILELMKSLQKDFNPALLFITHDLGVVAKMCDRVAVMYLGKIVESADTETIYANPQHPYTKGLIGSVHKIGGNREERLFSIEGTVPLAMNLPSQCGFYDRCTVAIDGLCNKIEPELVEIEPGHKVACFACNNEACKAECERARKMIPELERQKAAKAEAEAKDEAKGKKNLFGRRAK